MARSYQLSYGMLSFFTTLRLWIFTMARAPSILAGFLLTLGSHGFVCIIRKVEVIERHADIITSDIRNNNATSWPVTSPEVAISAISIEKPVTLWSRRKQEYGHLSSSPLTSATTFVIGRSEQTLYSFRDICYMISLFSLVSFSPCPALFFDWEGTSGEF